MFWNQFKFQVGYELGNDTLFPEWKEEPEFKAIREGYMEKKNN